ncbi:Uu.00g075940.m01.CDS01 [Anthostomella pinea]|uniref:diphosphoinositol-polyphosphate diphosphatase n=1 Tax=Anthostomella pinea TaxID=933095 RepID=A0AAI8VWH5_9PEZI|nr:Uu.00g075940.m01.CDS01 [Anthostomella pinea]
MDGKFSQNGQGHSGDKASTEGAMHLQTMDNVEAQYEAAQKADGNGQIERHITSSSKPPLNFGTVLQGLYRSSYPEAEHYSFIQGLKLKTIVTLVSKEMPDGFQQFMDANGITHKIFDMGGTKKEKIPVELMQSIIKVVTDKENYPMLIHCNQGKHRTGCVVGVIRMTNSWDTKRVLEEYTTFAAPKVRETDLKYLTNFKISSLPNLKPKNFTHTIGRYGYLTIMAFFTICLFIYSFSKMRIWSRRPREASSL